MPNFHIVIKSISEIKHRVKMIMCILYETKSKYVPIPVMQIAIIFGQRCFACIFSTDIFGKKTVKNIPTVKTKIG